MQETVALLAAAADSSAFAYSRSSSELHKAYTVQSKTHSLMVYLHLTTSLRYVDLVPLVGDHQLANVKTHSCAGRC